MKYIVHGSKNRIDSKILTYFRTLFETITTFRPIYNGPWSRDDVVLVMWRNSEIKEAINIRQQQPSINRDQGYHLPAIYSQIIPPISEFRHMTKTTSSRD